MTTHKTSKQIPLKAIFFPILTILIIISLSLFFIKYRLVDTDKVGRHGVNAVGDIVPDFAVTDMNGKKSTISTVKAKVIMLNFWATWCDACLTEMPSIVALRNQFHPQGFEVVGINLDENPAAVVPRAVQRYQISFPVFQDPSGTIAEIFDVMAIPLTVFMNSKREIIHYQNGEFDWSSEAVQNMLKGWLEKP